MPVSDSGASVRILVVSNQDRTRPYGQWTRPFFLGSGLAGGGAEVANVGVDCGAVDFGPAWSVGHQSLRRLVGGCRVAVRRFRPDVVYAHQNMPAAAALVAGSATGTPVVADFHSLPSLEWEALARAAEPSAAIRYELNRAKAWAAEEFVARCAAGVIAAGPELVDALGERHGQDLRAHVVPNGVDERLLKAPRSSRPAAYADGAPHAMSTLPSASTPANAIALAFLRDVVAELARLLPSAQVHVLGSDSGPEAPGLRYHGFQPELLPWIEHAGACLMPYPPEATAGGVRNKLLEYLARGRAVVTTREGLRGLPEASGWSGVTVAPDDAAGFAAALRTTLESDEEGLEAARAEVARRLRWASLASDVATYLSLVAAKP
jgi:glycosyltransferase involved in cell wall biosynthesis